MIFYLLTSLLRAVIAQNHLPYFKIFSNFVNVPFATFLFEKIAPMLLFSRIGPALICTSTWIRNVSFSENFAYVLNEWSLSSFFLQHSNLRFRKWRSCISFWKKITRMWRRWGTFHNFFLAFIDAFCIFLKGIKKTPADIIIKILIWSTAPEI